MAVQDRIRLIGTLRKSPAPAGFFYRARSTGLVTPSVRGEIAEAVQRALAREAREVLLVDPGERLRPARDQELEDVQVAAREMHSSLS